MGGCFCGSGSAWSCRSWVAATYRALLLRRTALPTAAAAGRHLPATQLEDVRALAAWTAERDRRKALRDAAHAWEDHVALQALAAELPARHATLADGLVRALTHPEGLKPVTVQLLLDPVSG